MRYWICDKLDHLISYVYTRRLFGPRCEEHLDGCAVCDAWRLHDDCFGNSEPDYTFNTEE